MDEKEKAEYLKNELKNYNKMKKWLEDDSNRFDMYIEFYNIKRPHRTLKNLTPCQMEENFNKNAK